MRSDLLYLPTHILFQITKRKEVDWGYRCSTGRALKSRLQLLILEGQHPAIRVIDDQELLRAEQVVGNEE